jgi:hypothetical protein
MSSIDHSNLNFINAIEFDQLTARLKINGNNQGELVGYLTVTVNKETGEILDIAKSARVFEGINILAAPIAIKRKSFLEADFKLELINQGDSRLPNSIKQIVEQAFNNFNAKE